MNNCRDQNNTSDFETHQDLSVVNLRNSSLRGAIQLTNYGNLTELDVSENNIEHLDLLELSKLQCLKCFKNQLTELLLNGSSLRSLVAANNKLKSVIISPDPANLEHLDISNNELEVLPDWLSKCNSLRSLLASHNRLSSLPEYIFSGDHSCLTILELSFNQLTTLPHIMHKMPLHQLYLHNNSLSTLPRHFFLASSSLKLLNVSKNCLKELPQFISRNENLEHLYLTSNALTDITPILNCFKLKVLHVAYNAIHSLPNGCVSAWREIEELIVSGNSLSQLPEKASSWIHLKVLKAHSNLISISPNLINSHSLKVLDLSYNRLERIDLVTLVPKQLQYLDLSGNDRLYVDPKQYEQYKVQRLMRLVDVSGHNRNSLPFSPSSSETNNRLLALPWTLGFSESTGIEKSLFVSQLRLPHFCNCEALLGIFDGITSVELPSSLIKTIPRILLEERRVKENAYEYMRHTMLSAQRELKDYANGWEICGTVCHISKQTIDVPATVAATEGGYGIQTYVLRIASVGNTKTILCRNSGSLTFAFGKDKNFEEENTITINSNKQNHHQPDLNVAEINLHEEDQYLLLANKNLWDVMSTEEAVAEVRSVTNPVLAAKRLQDLAQSYGSVNNLSIMVLRFHKLHSEQDFLMKGLEFTFKSNKTLQVPENTCTCDHNISLRSSPSGQSDKCNGSRSGCSYPENYQNYPTASSSANRKYSKQMAVKENDTYQNQHYQGTFIEPYNNGSVADGEESYSDRSAMNVPEERFRCWEYMLEKNTQLLFDRELDTLSKNFTKSSLPSRPGLWTPRAKSVSNLPDCVQNVPFLSKRFSSARSYNGGSRLEMRNLTRQSLNIGPNAAYFGSLQRLMPYHLEYNFAEIKQKMDNVDSLEYDGRIYKYWDLATTEL